MKSLCLALDIHLGLCPVVVANKNSLINLYHWYFQVTSSNYHSGNLDIWISGSTNRVLRISQLPILSREITLISPLDMPLDFAHIMSVTAQFMSLYNRSCHLRSNFWEDRGWKKALVWAHWCGRTPALCQWHEQTSNKWLHLKRRGYALHNHFSRQGKVDDVLISSASYPI